MLSKFWSHVIQVMLSKSCYHVIQEHSDASCCRLCFLATRRPATYEWFPEGIIDPSSQWYPTWILYRFHTTTGTFIMGMTYIFWTISWYMFLVYVFGICFWIYRILRLIFWNLGRCCDDIVVLAMCDGHLNRWILLNSMVYARYILYHSSIHEIILIEQGVQYHYRGPIADLEVVKNTTNVL